MDSRYFQNKLLTYSAGEWNGYFICEKVKRFQEIPVNKIRGTVQYVSRVSMRVFECVRARVRVRRRRNVLNFVVACRRDSCLKDILLNMLVLSMFALPYERSSREHDRINNIHGFNYIDVYGEWGGGTASLRGFQILTLIG